MPGIHVFRKKRKRKDGTVYHDKFFTAEITFGKRIAGGRKVRFLRSTECTQEREAKVEARKIAKRLEIEELPDYGRQFLTISEMFGKWWLEHASDQRTAHTMEGRVKNLLSFFKEDELIKDIGNKRVNEYIQHRKNDGVTGSTINRELDVLKKALNLAEKKWEEKVGKVYWPDFNQKEPKGIEVFVTPNEIKDLILNVPYHIKLAIAWSIKTGCRIEETETLIEPNLHFDFNIARVFAKGGDLNNIVLSDEAVAILKAALLRKKIIAEETRALLATVKSLVKPGTNFGERFYRRALKLSRTGSIETRAFIKKSRSEDVDEIFENIEKLLSTNLVFNLTNRRRYWTAARKTVGRMDLRWHDLRHGTGTWLRQYAGSDEKLIQKSLRHENSESTRRYVHAAPEEVLVAFNKLPSVIDDETLKAGCTIQQYHTTPNQGVITGPKNS